MEYSRVREGLGFERADHNNSDEQYFTVRWEMRPAPPPGHCKQVWRVKGQPYAEGFTPHQTLTTVLELNTADILMSEMRQLRIPAAEMLSEDHSAKGAQGWACHALAPKRGHVLDRHSSRMF